METLLIILGFCLGATIGSFLNVCFFRIPKNQKVNDPPRSQCPNCKKLIPWYENIPVISWLLLRGKCSSCSFPIPPWYFFIELGTGITTAVLTYCALKAIT